MGLVKLIEMRSVATIESILERLSSIGIDLPPAAATSNAASASASPILEKKTLNPEPLPPAEPIKVSIKPPEPPEEPEPVFRNHPSSLSLRHNLHRRRVPTSRPS